MIKSKTFNDIFLLISRWFHTKVCLILNSNLPTYLAWCSINDSPFRTKLSLAQIRREITTSSSWFKGRKINYSSKVKNDVSLGRKAVQNLCHNLLRSRKISQVSSLIGFSRLSRSESFVSPFPLSLTTVGWMENKKTAKVFWSRKTI